MIEMPAGPAFHFDRAEMLDDPFPHFVACEFLDDATAERLLQWFEHDAVWIEKNVELFYESHDLSLQSSKLPAALRFLVDDGFLAGVRAEVSRLFSARLGPRTDVTAHRLVEGQRIAIHSDFGELAQTHRLLVQLNRGWSLDHGGLLMFMGSERRTEPSSEDCYYLPEHRTAFCFAVSARSLHAVSRVRRGDRYTLCLSFYGEEA